MVPVKRRGLINCAQSTIILCTTLLDPPLEPAESDGLSKIVITASTLSFLLVFNLKLKATLCSTSKKSLLHRTEYEVAVQLALCL